MNKIEIKNFELSYDGMYFIKWENHLIRVFLGLNTILKMLEIEGLSYKEVNEIVSSGEPIKFSKVTLTVKGEYNEGKLILLTSDWSDNYLDKKNLSLIDVDLKEAD